MGEIVNSNIRGYSMVGTDFTPLLRPIELDLHFMKYHYSIHVAIDTKRKLVNCFTIIVRSAGGDCKNSEPIWLLLFCIMVRIY